MADHPKPPPPRREVISAAIPIWKKSMVEAARDKRNLKTTSAMVERYIDDGLRADGFPVDAPKAKASDEAGELDQAA